MTYAELFSKLTYETAVITFLKKDGTVRIMLCTRNINTISILYGFQGQALGGHDNRCNIQNGNLAAFDLILGEARSFNVQRVLNIQFADMGCTDGQPIVSTKEQLDKVIEKYVEYKNLYEQNNPMKLSFDSFDSIGGVVND